MNEAGADSLSSGFMPHGMCYLWQPGVLGLHVTADALISAAYFSIPFTLVYFVRKRTDLRFSWILVCFAVFIVACGASHLMEIWTIWRPDYWLSGAVKAVTALASVPTAILLAKLVPVALRLPSPSALEDANRELAREVAERKAAEATVRAINSSLEARVAERTAELESANARVAGTAEQLRLTIEAAPTSMIMADGAGTMVLVNAAVERLFGYRREQLLGRPLAMLLPERLRPWRGEIAADLLGLRHDGSEVPIEIAQNTLKTPDGEFVLSTIVDLSYRKRAEQLQQQMTALVESADDAILTLSLEGRVESWNPAAERLLCYPAADIIGRPVSLLLPDDRKNEEDMFLERIREGSHVAHYETVRRRSDGSLVDVSLTISPIHTPTGAVVGASKIMRDISERRHFIEQLQDLNLALEQRVDARTAELKEREALLQEIHHRVKNNLQVISSLISMQARSLADAPSRAALRQCQARVATMAQIHEMLYQSKDYTRVPFSKYAQDLAVRVVSASGLSPGAIGLKFALDELWLAVDKAIPCGLILNELVANAVKHGFPDGLNGTIHVALSHHDGQVELSVADDGVGLPAEFDRAKSASLGVQLVSTLAEQLDGRFDIVRGPQAEFRVTFPLEVTA